MLTAPMAIIFTRFSALKKQESKNLGQSCVFFVEEAFLPLLSKREKEEAEGKEKEPTEVKKSALSFLFCVLVCVCLSRGRASYSKKTYM